MEGRDKVHSSDSQYGTTMDWNVTVTRKAQIVVEDLST